MADQTSEPIHTQAGGRSGLRWILAALALLLLIGGAWLWRYMRTYESTDDAQVDGRIHSISARVNGYVTEVDVNDLQTVKKGDVLVRIDPRDYEVAVERARAELADAEATAQALTLSVPVTSVETVTQVSSSEADLGTARATILWAQKMVDSAEAQRQQAEANNARAQSDLARYTELVAKDEVSRQVYEQAIASAKASAATVEAARASAAAAEQTVEQSKGKLAQAEAALQYSQTGPQQLAVSRARAQAALATVAEKASGASSGRTQSRILHRGRARQRRGEKERRSRHERAAGTHAAFHRGSGRRVDHCEFQGDADRAHAARPARDDFRGRLLRRREPAISRASPAPAARASACCPRKMPPATT